MIIIVSGGTTFVVAHHGQKYYFIDSHGAYSGNGGIISGDNIEKIMEHVSKNNDNYKSILTKFSLVDSKELHSQYWEQLSSNPIYGDHFLYDNQIEYLTLTLKDVEHKEKYDDILKDPTYIEMKERFRLIDNKINEANKMISNTNLLLQHLNEEEKKTAEGTLKELTEQLTKLELSKKELQCEIKLYECEHKKKILEGNKSIKGGYYKDIYYHNKKIYHRNINNMTK